MSKPIAGSIAVTANRNFITWCGVPEATRIAAQSLLLQGLEHPDVGPEATGPLVAMDPVTVPPVCIQVIYTKAYMKGLSLPIDKSIEAIQFKTDSPSLHQALFHRARLLDTILKGKRTLYIEPAYAHRTLSAWNGKSDVERLLIIASHYANKGFIPFTVNFGERLLQTITANPDRAFKTLGNKLVKVNTLGPLVLALEANDKGRFHLHGFVDTDASPKQVWDLLIHLGGRSSNLHFRNRRQVHVWPRTCHPIGWANYLIKDIIKLPDQQRSSRIYISQAAMKVGRNHLDELRLQCEQKLSVRPGLRGRASADVPRFRDGAGRFTPAGSSLH